MEAEARRILQTALTPQGAGADVLTTNTFGAQRLGLEKYGLADRVRDINRAGATIARRVADAADRPVLVAGSIGPLATQWHPEEAGQEMIAEQVAARRYCAAIGNMRIVSPYRQVSGSDKPRPGNIARTAAATCSP